jgi:hypothetical protein
VQRDAAPFCARLEQDVRHDDLRWSGVHGVPNASRGPCGHRGPEGAIIYVDVQVKREIGVARHRSAYTSGAETWVCGVGAKHPHAPAHKAARYDRRQATHWGRNNLPPRGRHDEARALSHVTSVLVMERTDYRTTQV